MQMQKKFAGNQNQSYRSVIKTLLLKEKTWARSKHVCCDERFLSLAQIDKLYHELKLNIYAYESCAFYWPKYACINLADVWTVNLLVHGTCLDKW